MVITMEILAIDSFGVPFSWPLAPKEWRGLKSDTFKVSHTEKCV